MAAQSLAFTLRMNTSVVNRIALTAATRTVTDTTRRVLNRATVLTPVDTGRLRAGNQMRVRTVGMKVTGEVFNLTSYAGPVHDGNRAYTVRPVNKKALRFTVGGVVVFAKWAHIPARRGRPWIYRALLEVAGPQGYTITRLR